MPSSDINFLNDAQATSVGFRAKPRNIPFFVPSENSVKVKILYDKFENTADFREKMSAIRRKTIHRFMLHFFPEFYLSYRIDARGKDPLENTPEFAAAQTTYQRLRDMFNKSVTALYYRPHDPQHKPTKDIVLASFFNLEFGFNQKRSGVVKRICFRLFYLSKSPGFEYS